MIFCLDGRGTMYKCYQELFMLENWKTYGSIVLTPDTCGVDKLVMVFGPFQIPGMFGCVGEKNTHATNLLKKLLGGASYGSIYGNAYVIQMNHDDYPVDLNHSHVDRMIELIVEDDE